MATSELHPYSKTGGLADMVAARAAEKRAMMAHAAKAGALLVSLGNSLGDEPLSKGAKGPQGSAQEHRTGCVAMPHTLTYQRQDHTPCFPNPHRGFVE